MRTSFPNRIMMTAPEMADDMETIDGPTKVSLKTPEVDTDSVDQKVIALGVLDENNQ